MSDGQRLSDYEAIPHTSPEQTTLARAAITRHAHDTDDAARLLAALGLEE